MAFYASLHQMPSLLGNSTAVYSDALPISNDVDLARCWSAARPEISSDYLKLSKFDGFDLPTWFGQGLPVGVSADGCASGLLTAGLLSSNTNELVHNINEQQSYVDASFNDSVVQQSYVDAPFNDNVVPQLSGAELFYSDFESLSPPLSNSPDSSAASLSSENFYNLEEFLQDSPLSSPGGSGGGCGDGGGGGGSCSSADSFSIDKFLIDQFELPAANSASPSASVALLSDNEAFAGITNLLRDVTSADLLSPGSGMSSVVPESPQSNAQSPLSYLQQLSTETNVGSIAFESESSFGDFSTVDFSMFNCDEVMSEESCVGDSATSINPVLSSVPSAASSTTKYIPILPKKSLWKSTTAKTSRKRRRSESYPTATSLVVGVTGGGEVVSEPMAPPEPPPPPKKKVKTKEQKMRKKDQNKDAALRYRQKKKGEVDTVTVEADELEERNRSLRGRVGSLRKEIEYLKELMLDVITTRLRSPPDADGRSCDRDAASHDDCTDAAIEALQKYA